MGAKKILKIKTNSQFPNRLPNIFDSTLHMFLIIMICGNTLDAQIHFFAIYLFV